MIKLFASDLDGTLLTDHVVDSVVQDALRAIRAADRDFAVVTGRTLYPHHQTIPGLEDLSVYTICMNGALILDPTGEPMFRRVLDREIIAGLLENFPDLPLEYITENSTMVHLDREVYLTFPWRDANWDASPFLKLFLQRAEFGIQAEQLRNTEILKVNARVHDPVRIAALNDFLSQHREQVQNHPYVENNPSVFELTASDIDKGPALETLMHLLDCRPEEVAVYGDGPNDAGMLRRFPNSFAPAEASASAQTAAGAVIGPCADHAVPLHMLQLLELS